MKEGITMKKTSFMSKKIEDVKDKINKRRIYKLLDKYEKIDKLKDEINKAYGRD